MKRSTDVWAIVPAAGLGKRLAPVTRGMPKEMMRVDSRPMIELAVLEAMGAGLNKIIVVIRHRKEIIREYLDRRFKVEISSGLLQIRYVYQPAPPRGVGHAPYVAAGTIGNAAFTMLIPDQFVFPLTPSLKCLLTYASSRPSAVWCGHIRPTDENCRHFAGCREYTVRAEQNGFWRVTGLHITQPGLKEHSVTGFGRTYFPAGSRRFLTSQYINPKTREVDLLPSFIQILKELDCFTVELPGQAADFGTWESWLHFSRKQFPLEVPE